MHKSSGVIVPPFLSDDPQTRDDLASYYNEVTRFDYYIGEVVSELKRQGVFDNTLIFVLADNGRPFPRAKTRLHDSGMKTALVAHWSDGIKVTGPSNSLVSVIDLAPTILSLADCDVPESMQGVYVKPLLDGTSSSIRQYAFSEHNWHDYEAHGRSVRSGDYLLVKNFRTSLAWQGPADSVRSVSHQKLLALRDANMLSAAQADVLLQPRPETEFYNVANDPHQLSNLAGDPLVASQQSKLTAVLEQWMDETGDSVTPVISPDTFDRETGKPLPKASVNKESVVTPGEDHHADTINASGPR